MTVKEFLEKKNITEKNCYNLKDIYNGTEKYISVVIMAHRKITADKKVILDHYNAEIISECHILHHGFRRVGMDYCLSGDDIHFIYNKDTMEVVL